LKEKVYDMGGSNEMIWTFLVSGTILGLFVLACTILISLLLATFVFQAACALADVETPGFFFSMLLVLLTGAVCVPLNWGVVYLYTRTLLYQWMSGWASFVLLSVIAFVLCVGVSAALYTPILRISLKKGVLTGLFEQLIGLLLFTLVYGAVLVILAVTQIVTNRNKPAPAPPKAVLVRPAPAAAGLPS
jgi:hypothetical protein